MSGLEIRFARADDERLAALAPEHWRQKAASRRFGKDRRLELVAGGLLAEMIGAMPSPTGAGGAVRIGESPDGKPFLADRPEMHFNLSHSEDVVMCVVADHPVGCDVERDVPLDDDTRRLVGSIGEWTLREAKFKCGAGAGEPFTVEAPEGYRAAVCESTGSR